MGDVVKECGVLQRKVESLENQLQQLHNEYTTFRQTSVSSTESAFTGSQKSGNEQLSSSLNLSSKKRNNILLTRFLSIDNPKVTFTQ